LSERFSIGLNLAPAWECEKDEQGDRHMNAIIAYAGVLGITISERLSGFIEYFGDAPVNPTGKPANLIDGGFTFLVKDNFQLDLAGGVGMTEVSEDWFLGAGISYRYPR
jgi:hypothetical protein